MITIVFAFYTNYRSTAKPQTIDFTEKEVTKEPTTSATKIGKDNVIAPKNTLNLLFTPKRELPKKEPLKNVTVDEKSVTDSATGRTVTNHSSL